MNLLNIIDKLPIRKTKSKFTYCVYYLIHLIDNEEYYYIGSTKNFNQRYKAHSKTKNIKSHGIIFDGCNSLANIKILESYLILKYKLETDLKLSNKRCEMCVF